MKKEKSKIVFWDFVNKNPWSSLFTLIFIGDCIREFLQPEMSFEKKVIVLGVGLVVLGLITFSSKMAKFVDDYAFIYWILLGSFSSFIASLPVG